MVVLPKLFRQLLQLSLALVVKPRAITTNLLDFIIPGDHKFYGSIKRRKISLRKLAKA